MRHIVPDAVLEVVFEVWLQVHCVDVVLEVWLQAYCA